MKRELTRRQTVLAGLLGAGAVGAAASWGGLFALLESFMTQNSKLPATDRMPVLFVGHGSPTSAIQPNEWTRTWETLSASLPRPRAILSISAHWLTRNGALVTASPQPQMNYDMSGFPREMYEIVYPAPGSAELAADVEEALGRTMLVRGDTEWGFDHATWVVLKYMFPKADIPVIQLSIDYDREPAFHYELGKLLQPLRSKGVLIMGSGNMVHNLGMRPGTNGNQPYDWALEFDHTVWTRIQEGNHPAVVDFQKLGSMAAMAHPTYDHFLPLIYCLGLVTPKDEIQTFNDSFQWPAVSMRSLRIG